MTTGKRMGSMAAQRESEKSAGRRRQIVVDPAAGVFTGSPGERLTTLRTE